MPTLPGSRRLIVQLRSAAFSYTQHMWIFIARLGILAAGLWLTLIGASVVAGRTMPDNGKVVFDSSWNGNRERIIYMVDVDSGTFHNLTLHQHIDGAPVLSPDGSRMAFVSAQEDSLYLPSLVARWPPHRL
jgi:hypothetical protein